jgi:predicted Zn-dependent protease
MKKKIDFQISRRAMVGGLTAAGGFAAALPAMADFSFGLGPISTDDFKTLGRLFKGVSFSEEDELAMGQGLFGPLIDSVGGQYKNSGVQSSMDRFAANLFANTERPTFPWEIAVVDDNTVNAWALPGGKIAINKGMLRYVNNEHELAAVVSHEMGHIEKSHAVAAMKNNAFWDVVSTAGQRAIQTQIDTSGAGGMLASAALNELQGPMLQLVTSGYSRDAEREADQHVVTMFEKTGHDVDSGVGIYRTMLELVPKKSKGTTSLFSGHPDMKKRIKALEEAAAEMPASGGGPNDGFDGLKQPFPTRMVFRRND